MFLPMKDEPMLSAITRHIITGIRQNGVRVKEDPITDTHQSSMSFEIDGVEYFIIIAERQTRVKECDIR